MNSVFHAVSVFVVCSALVSSGCGRGSSPDPAPADSVAQPEGNPQETARPVEPEVIDQAAGEQVNPIDAAEGDSSLGASGSDPSQNASENPVLSLPGFSPSPVAKERAASTASPQPTTQPLVAGTAQVLVQVSVYELKPSGPKDLAPIEQFLGSSPATALSPEELAAFTEMISVLQSSGVVSTLSSPRVLVPSGSEATIEITQLGGGQVGGVPTGRSSLLFSVLPTVHPAEAESESARVGFEYELKFGEADSAFQVLAQDLGLNIGSRAGASGAATVPDQHTFFFLRRVVGDRTDRELLVLVRPKVMHADLTK